jgi:Uma2 family endonuclease/DNA-binding XRE family transcriptional regulator
MNVIRDLRKKRKMTQSQLAKSLGVATSTVSNWEVEKHEPDFESLKKLAFFFQVTIDYIIGYDQFQENRRILDRSSTVPYNKRTEGMLSYVNEAVPKYDDYYTYADLGYFPEGEIWELINGIAYKRFTPSISHQAISKNLFIQIFDFLKDKPCEVFYAPVCVRLNADKADDTVLVPDILVVCDETKYEDGFTVVGPPDLVVEILSPSTALHDWNRKYQQYEKYGVKEYWIVDPLNSLLVVHILGEKEYTGKTYEDKETNVPITVLEGCIINLEEVFK